MRTRSLGVLIGALAGLAAGITAGWLAIRGERTSPDESDRIRLYFSKWDWVKSGECSSGDSFTFMTHTNASWIGMESRTGEGSEHGRGATAPVLFRHIPPPDEKAGKDKGFMEMRVNPLPEPPRKAPSKNGTYWKLVKGNYRVALSDTSVDTAPVKVKFTVYATRKPDDWRKVESHP